MKIERPSRLASSGLSVAVEEDRNGWLCFFCGWEVIILKVLTDLEPHHLEADMVEVGGFPRISRN